MRDVEEIDPVSEKRRFWDRPSEIVELSIPVDAMTRVRELAAAQEMPPEALLKMYIGNGLRPEKTQASERSLATIAYVLARHIASAEERAAILSELAKLSSGSAYAIGASGDAGEQKQDASRVAG